MKSLMAPLTLLSVIDFILTVEKIHRFFVSIHKYLEVHICYC